MNDLVESIRERYQSTRAKITEAAERAGRDPKAVQLVVVTKSQPLEVVRAAIEAGATVLGENYAEEAVEKIEQLAGYSAVEWHMIGHVQSRKAALVARHFQLLHSLDGLKLANRLNRFSEETGRILPALLEFNVGEESSKSGWGAADETHWPALVDDVSAIAALPNLRLRGLMTMPPLGTSAEDSRPYFRKLRRLAAFLSERLQQTAFPDLSMGTSLDYEVAVEEGATLVRVGTAIVGARRVEAEPV